MSQVWHFDMLISLMKGNLEAFKAAWGLKVSLNFLVFPSEHREGWLLSTLTGLKKFQVKETWLS